MARSKKRPLPVTPALVDLRMVLVAAVVASPAAYRASQGLLSPDQAMARFLVVLLAVAAVTALVRAAWPLVAGESPAPETPQMHAEPETQAGPDSGAGVSPPLG